ncbi:MAG: type II secretion system F family protein [Candidatus Aenigmatarchaeota archaeon]
MRKTPLIPMPPKIMEKISRKFIGIGNFLSKIYPATKMELLMADIDVDDRVYLTLAFISGFFWFLFTFFILVFVSRFRPLPIYFLISIPIVLFFSTFFYIKYYPKLLISRKSREIEKNLLFALRNMEIQVSSGVSLFDSLVSISRGDYGVISEEFKEVIKKISTGKPEIEALEELAIKNPSNYFRRVIWQITNSMRSGADLSSTLRVIVDDLSYERMVSIRRYGSQLNPMAMMYMMMSVIFPTLGVSFLMIISSFTSFSLSGSIFWFILIFTAFFQFMFIGLIKNRRPQTE